jgi:arginine decarboxylase
MASCDHSEAPLLAALAASAARPHAPFYAPGHKRGQGSPAALRQLFGAAVFRADLPELPELDNLFAPVGPIAQAQALAADAFGAEQSWFLANGSTCGIEAAVLAQCRPGDKIIVPRNAHRSVVSALILSGAMPVWVQPEYDPAWDLVQGVRPEAIAEALAAHPDSRAVLLVSPTYHGICSDIGAIAALTHAHGLPLLVDEAHGPHFCFHPELPQAALAAGADLVVQSTHKVLSALTQASMLHVQGNHICRSQLQRSLALTQSTSPSYLLLASLDAARQQMALHGQAHLTAVLELAQQARSRLAAIAGLRVFGPADAAARGYALDPSRLTVAVMGLGLSGFAADEALHQIWGVTAELPALQHLTFILSLGNTAADIEQLVAAFVGLSREAQPASNPARQPPILLALAQLPALTPRDAFFAPTEAVPLAAAVGRLSGETLCPYPPGIPLLLPGETICAEAIQSLQQIHQAGGSITGAADPSLTYLTVLEA